jgi:alkaline phosphatase D
LTHSYANFKGEPNQYRIKDVVIEKRFGILKFDFDKLTVTMQMQGEDNVLQQELIQSY